MSTKSDGRRTKALVLVRFFVRNYGGGIEFVGPKGLHMQYPSITTSDEAACLYSTDSSVLPTLPISCQGEKRMRNLAALSFLYSR